LKPSYEDLKRIYAHERSIHLDSEITGTVYTPIWVAKQMVYVLLKNYMQINHDAFDIEGVRFDALYLQAYLKGDSITAHEAETWLPILLPLTILDLSCGTGVLLIAYLEFIEYLIKHAPLYSNEWLCNLVQNQMVGIDIDQRAVDGFVQLLDEFSRSRGILPTQFRIYCQNSLIDDLVDDTEKFDLVIGNPPYIGEKNNLSYFTPIKQTPLGKAYYEGKMDYFYFFIYKGSSYLKEKGCMCYLSSNYFLTADGAKKMRLFIKETLNLSTYIDYGDVFVFPEKKLHACVYVLQKKRVTQVYIYDATLTLKKKIPISRIYHTDGTIQFILSDDAQKILSMMSQQMVATLGDCYEIHQGIVSGSDKQFVYSDKVTDMLPRALKPYLVPFYKNSDIKHYYTSTNTPLSLLYLDQPEVHEDVLKWLNPYKEKLMNRREVVNHYREWYMLTWPRKRELFVNEKIVVPQRAKSNRFAYVKQAFYASADVYYITTKARSPYTLQVLTMLLNSDLTLLWLTHMGKKKGTLLELYATPLKNIPIPKLDTEALIQLTVFSDELYASAICPDDQRLAVIKREVDALLSRVLNDSDKQNL